MTTHDGKCCGNCDAFVWTRPNEHRCDRCGYGVWQSVEPHAFHCLAPCGERVTASNRGWRGAECGMFEPRGIRR